MDRWSLNTGDHKDRFHSTAIIDNRHTLPMNYSIDFGSVVLHHNPLVQNGILTMNEGTSTRISYAIDSNPPTDITLSRANQEPIHGTRLRVTYQALLINDVLRDDAGHYTLTFIHQLTSTHFFEFNLVVHRK